MTKVVPDRHQAGESFRGFEPLKSNYIYCPNQFLDVCIPNCSRGVVRLVAYVLKQTLGWLDKNGQPVEQDIAIPYSQLVNEAGISRGAIGASIRDAVCEGFLVCVQPGRQDGFQAPAQTAQYRLNWDASNPYQKSLSGFSGFFAGEGHRTPIPNAFFDRIVRSEPLSVIKVVSTVLRHTVGYRNQFGGRRESASLSYSFISEATQMSDGKAVRDAIKRAIDAGYIQRLKQGTFGPSTAHRQAAHYAVRWLAEAENITTGSKIPAADSDRFKNPSSTGSEFPAANRFKNPRQERQKKNTYKQQQTAAEKNGFEMLTEFGFDRAAAKRIADEHPAREVEQQIGWLKHRGTQHNKLGMLRRAIEEGWAEPPVCRVKRRDKERRAIERAAMEASTEDPERAARRGRKNALLKVWDGLTSEEREQHKQAAIAAEESAALRTILTKRSIADEPPTAFLDACAKQHGLPPVTLLNSDNDVEINASANPSNA